MGTFISLSLSASMIRSWLSTESTGPARHGNANLDHLRAKGGAGSGDEPPLIFRRRFNWVGLPWLTLPVGNIALPPVPLMADRGRVHIVDRLGQSVVTAVLPLTDRCFDTCLIQLLHIVHRQVPTSPVAVMYQPVRIPAGPQRLLHHLLHQLALQRSGPTPVRHPPDTDHRGKRCIEKCRKKPAVVPCQSSVLGSVILAKSTRSHLPLFRYSLFPCLG